jgi:thymidylate synthase (FAD)
MNIQCLDKGFVELITHTEKGDLLVVNAARCSFDKEHEIFNEDKDTKLISYLARNGHLLPFRHPHATFRIYCPIFVLRQLGKHQVGFSWSEVSRRYITTEPEFYFPENWRSKADNVKQGSSKEVSPWNESCKADVEYLFKDALYSYNLMIDRGVCPEQARMVLPQAMYTTTIVTGSLLGWHHLFTQRTDSHAQVETQEFAKAIGQVLNNFYPVSWKALCDEKNTNNR